MMGGGGFQGPVDIVARLSRTGDAIPTKGDLEGVAKNVTVPSKNVKLTIDTVRQERRSSARTASRVVLARLLSRTMRRSSA
jgi:hypothetical protein